MTAPSTHHADPVTLDVLRSLANGLDDREAAKRAHVSTRTVQRIVDNFKVSAGVSTRFAAGAAACRLGLLDDPPGRPGPGGRAG